jgi:glycosyltransferase involved in cell wall biosynthesis
MKLYSFQPKISVITVCYNAATLLEGTILSVINQTYANLEYIIVDGKSKDNSLDFVKKYESKISKWISEPDKGIYDAMSKGQALATGDYVIFMNAGDRFFDNKTIEYIDNQTDAFYGDVMLVEADRTHVALRSEATVHLLPKKLTWKSYDMGMVVCHQGIFMRRTLCEPYLEKNLSADIEWSITALKKAKKTVNTGLVISEYLKGGISKQKHKQSLWDRYDILKQHFGIFGALYSHFKIIFRAVIFKIKRIGKEAY